MKKVVIQTIKSNNDYFIYADDVIVERFDNVFDAIEYMKEVAFTYTNVIVR